MNPDNRKYGSLRKIVSEPHLQGQLEGKMDKKDVLRKNGVERQLLNAVKARKIRYFVSINFTAK